MNEKDKRKLYNKTIKKLKLFLEKNYTQVKKEEKK